ncbi:MAG: L-rhamnose mutarotase [bacterium]
MSRYGFMMRLRNEDVIPEYKRMHDEIGEDVLEVHRRAGIRNYSIFRFNLDLFGYFEADDPAQCIVQLGQEPVIHSWWSRAEPLLETDKNGRPIFTELLEIFYMS